MHAAHTTMLIYNIDTLERKKKAPLIIKKRLKLVECNSKTVQKLWRWMDECVCARVSYVKLETSMSVLVRQKNYCKGLEKKNSI
jgi:hypothetical protein